MSESPYRGLPDHCFWQRGVADLAIGDVDPVVAAPFLIARDDKVATAGSCFAQHIGRHLRRSGLNYLLTEPPHPILSAEEAAAYHYGTYTARYGNIYTVRQLVQLFQRAYGAFQPEEDRWDEADGYVDPFRPRIQPEGFRTVEEFDDDRGRHLAAVRTAFESLSVFVFTFGLTEGWVSRRDGAVFPLCPGVAGGRFDAGRHVLHNFSVGEVIEDGLAFIDLLRSVNRTARVILTVSPVPLAATAVATEHVLSATTYSKSVLRVACGEIAERRSQVAYVPAYEIITGSYARGRYFDPDGRSVNGAGVAHVMRVFLRAFAGLEVASGTEQAVGAPEPGLPEPGLLEPGLLEPGMGELVAVNCEEALLGMPDGAPGGVEVLGFCCNLCGGRDFGPGPGGRMTADGKGPLCRPCGSLERGRAVASLFRAMPREALVWRRALLLGSDQGVDPRWFGQCTAFAWPGGAPVPSQLDDQADGGYDVVSLIHVLEFIEEDRAFFDRLVRLLSPEGLLQIRFLEPERREATVVQDGGKGQARRLYGVDVARWFRCAEAGLAVAAVEGTDPHTGRRMLVHFFARRAQVLELLPYERRSLLVAA